MNKIKFYKRLVLSIVVLLVVFFSSCNMQKANITDTINIIPKPVNVELKKGSFILTADTKIFCNNEFIKLGNLFAQQIESLYDLKLNVISEALELGVIILELDETINKDDGYTLNISKEKIIISGKNSAGIFYGAQTLLQLISGGIHSKAAVSISCAVIDDYPRFKWRGMHLDVSRHFFTTEEVKKYIDILALHKLNVFHWHLTDDQGWRIEIKKYPKLTKLGAWREDRRGDVWTIDDDQRISYDERKPYYGGFYTQDEIKEVVRYAQDRFITIVPEIEMPGHSRAALVAYPELSCFGYETKVPSAGYVGENWDFSDPFCAGSEETFDFFENVLDEVMELFPSEYIHIGGDECSKNRWSQCSRCQSRIKAEGLKDEFELQSYFIKRIEKYVISKGRKIIGWQEILEGGMDSSAAIMPWRGESALEVCVEAAQGGHEVITVPSDFMYFNHHWPNDKAVEEHSLSLEKVYGYNPIPNGLENMYHKSIIGLEACLWSEYTPLFKDVEYQVMPRISALSEIAWTNKENKNYEDFLIRLNILKAVYREMDINYFVPFPHGLPPKTVFIEKVSVNMEIPRNGFTLRYTTDGTDPIEGSTVYLNSFELSETTIVKATIFDEYGQKSKVVTSIFEKQEFQKAKFITNPQPGIRYKTFNNRFKSARLVGGMPAKTGVIETVRIVDENKSENAGLILEGFVNIPEQAIYTFYLASEDGSVLFINDTLVVDNDGFHSGEDKEGNLIFKSGQVALDKGYQSITIKYFDWGDGELLRLFIESPFYEKQEVGSDILLYKTL